MSTACGTVIQARQTWPTVYVTTRYPATALWTLGAATNASVTATPIDYGKIVYGEIYWTGDNSATNLLYEFYSQIYANGTAADIVVKQFRPNYPRGRVTAFADRITGVAYSTSAANYAFRKTGTGNTTVGIFFYTVTRPANELEIAAYNAGWRP
jgi:hypothetical protein